MYRLLVADSTDIFADALCAALDGKFELTSCVDGTQVPELVRLFQPDILALDLHMPGMDGISILENIQDAGYKPLVLVTTRLFTDYIQESLVRLRVEYAISKPCKLQCVVQRIQDLADQYLSGKTDHQNEKEIAERSLLNLGFRPSLIGYRCAAEAIRLIVGDPELALTKQVYPAVAKLCGTSEAQVEHAIRLAIADAWKHHDDVVWASYFPKDKDGSIRRPTNAVLLTRLAASIRKRT